MAQFWNRVDKNGPLFNGSRCWQWTGYIEDGYGRYGRGPGTRQAHVLAYRMLVGEPPTGLEPDHLCRNRACVNPDHLEWVTTRVNVLRGIGITARNAVKTHCLHGHEYTEANTYVRKGKRSCRICIRGRNAAQRAKR